MSASAALAGRGPSPGTAAARRTPARGVQALWPFVAEHSAVSVERWNPAAAADSIAALVLADEDLPSSAAALCRRASEAHAQLLPGAGIALLAGNPWRAALRGRPSPGPGLSAMRHALQHAAFEDVRFYAVAPSAADPYLLRVAGRLATRLAPAMLVSARRRGAGAPRLLDSLPTRLADEGALPPGSQVRCVMCSGKDKTLVFLGRDRPRWLARLPWSPAAASAEDKAHRLLQRLGAEPPLASLLPRPLYRGRIDGQPVLLETLVAGKPLSTQLDSARRGSFAVEAQRFLKLLNPAPTGWCHDLMHGFGLPLLDGLAPHLPDRALLAPLHAALSEALAGVRCRLGLVHGDFGTKNIFADGDRIVGVIDWENARHEAPLVLDAMSYLDSAQRRVHRGQTLADTVPLLAAGGWPQAAEAAWLQRELQEGATDARGRRGLALLYWLAHVGPQLSFGGRDGSDGARFEAVLHWAAATAARPA